MSDESLIDEPTPDSDDPEVAEESIVDDEGIEDATEVQSEDDYDFAAFVQGVRPTRRAVMLYQNNDVRADYDLLKEKIEMKRAAGEDVSEDQELLAEVAAELIGSGRKVIVEARSSDWVKQFRRDMKKRGIEPSKEKASEEARAMMMTQFINEFIAAHIVYPRTGISADAIAALAEANEQEVERLHQAVRSADGERGVSPDFLRAHSAGSRSGSRLSRRP